MATTTIKIEPSRELEAMLKRVAEEATRPFTERQTKAEAALLELRERVAEQAERLAAVPTPFGPTGDRMAAMLDEITAALRGLVK